MKILVPVKILDNMTSPRFLGDEEIAASLPAIDQKVLWHFAGGSTSDDDCSVVEGYLKENEGYYVEDIEDKTHWDLGEFDFWYKEIYALQFVREQNKAHEIFIG